MLSIINKATNAQSKTEGKQLDFIDSGELTAADNITWALQMMIRSSKAREAYFKRTIARINYSIKTDEFKIDRKTGCPTKNSEMYDAIHVDNIFRVIQTIESFQGALASAWEFSTSTSLNLKELFSILINPKGHMGGIDSKLKKKKLSEEAICRLTAVPLLKRYEKPVAKKLRMFLRDAFMKFEESAHYSKKFRDEFEIVRHVYTHNYRFVFTERVVAASRSGRDESIIGFLETPDVSSGLVYIGANQRIAMGELVFLLADFERWIFENMRTTILNECMPVLPRRIPFLDSVQQQEYEGLWNSQGYDIRDPLMHWWQPIKVDNQIILIEDFLGVLKGWGFDV